MLCRPPTPETDARSGRVQQGDGCSIDAASSRQPLGVVARITLLNLPAMLPMQMFPMALSS